MSWRLECFEVFGMTISLVGLASSWITMHWIQETCAWGHCYYFELFLKEVSHWERLHRHIYLWNEMSFRFSDWINYGIIKLAVILVLNEWFIIRCFKWCWIEIISQFCILKHFKETSNSTSDWTANVWSFVIFYMNSRFNFIAKKLRRRMQHLGGCEVIEPGFSDDQHDYGSV